MFNIQAPELKHAHVSLVGLGLMGGSLAMALKPYVRTLTAVEMDLETRTLALDRAIVDAVTDNLQDGAREADVIVLATPVHAVLDIIRTLPEWRSRPCFLLDLGSTKREICAAMDELPEHISAVGGHPMCGKEMSGLSFADATLFQGKTFVFCRTRRTTNAMEQFACAMADVIGAISLWLPAEDHDRQVALVSHLPFTLSALLVELASSEAGADGLLWALSASGFRDTSRLAGSDPRMMQDILETNRGAVLNALRQYASRLEQLVALLDSEDRMALEIWLQNRQQEYWHYRQARGPESGAAR